MNDYPPPGSVEDGRAVPPGRRARPRFVIGGIAAVLVAALGWGTYGIVHPSRPALADVVHHLPKQQLDNPADRTLTGTYANPALTIEGDYVRVKAPTFSALALVWGPEVPGEGLPNQMNFDTCTWAISFSHVKGTVPISIADFDSIDHSGQVFKLYPVPGQPKLPTSVTTGHTARFELRAVMPVGEGLMRWAPNGNNIIAKWDYQVEND